MKRTNVMLVLIALLFGVGLLAGRWWRSDPAAAAIALRVDQDCDITTQRCALQAPGLHLSLALGPNPAVMQPFSVTLAEADSRGPDLDEAIIGFSMDGMDMGLNRYRLEPAENGSWQAWVTLPVCASGRHDWRAELLLKSRSGEHYWAQLPFVTH